LSGRTKVPESTGCVGGGANDTLNTHLFRRLSYKRNLV
jgi:hypothetical protein